VDLVQLVDTRQRRWHKRLSAFVLRARVSFAEDTGRCVTSFVVDENARFEDRDLKRPRFACRENRSIRIQNVKRYAFSGIGETRGDAWDSFSCFRFRKFLVRPERTGTALSFQMRGYGKANTPKVSLPALRASIARQIRFQAALIRRDLSR